MGSYLTLVTCVCPVCLVDGLALVFSAPFGIVVVLLFLLNMVSMVLVLCCLALGEWNASIVSLQEFDIRYMF